MKRLLAGLMVCALPVLGADVKVKVDSQETTASDLTVYESESGSILVTFYTDGVTNAVTGDVTFWYGTNGLGSTAIYSITGIVSNATSATLTYTTNDFPEITPSMMPWTYGVSVDEKVWGDGDLYVKDNPYSEGGVLDLFAMYLIQWASVTQYTGTAAYGPVRADGVTITNVVNADGSITLYADESDPIWSAVAATVTANAANGATAFGWGDHGTNGYLTAESDPVWAAVSNTVTVGAAAGATAYGWGDHATNSYLSAVPTLQQVANAGALTATNTMTVNGLTVNGPSQLGNVATRNHGINMPTSLNVGINEVFKPTWVEGAPDTDMIFGRITEMQATNNYSDDIIITGTRQTMTLSGPQTGAIDYTVRGNRAYISDSKTYNNTNLNVLQTGSYVGFEGVPTITAINQFYRYGYMAYQSHNLGTSGDTRKCGFTATLAGTADINYGAYLYAAGATANYALWCDAGDVVLDNANQKLYWGEAQENAIYNDGADMIIDPGSDAVLIGPAGAGYIKAGRVYLNASDYWYSDGTNAIWSNN